MPRRPGRESTRPTYPLDGTLIHRFTALSSEGRLRCGVRQCGVVWDAFTGGGWGVQKSWPTGDRDRLMYPVCPAHTVQITRVPLDPPF